MNDYQKVLLRLYNLQKFGIKFGLSSTKNLLKKLGDPHLALKCVHLAGTNGKGSVGAILEAIFSVANFKVGFYSSPHLIRFNERFRLCKIEISEAEVVKLTEEIWSKVDIREPPTFFEFITVLALLYYARQGVEWVVLETGLGGRLDATNICRSVITVVTNVGLEHQEYLGHTLAAIAYEKAGIIKSGVPLVHGITQVIARRVVEERAVRLGVPYMRLGRDVRIRRTSDVKFNLYGHTQRLINLSTNLKGRHQVLNSGIAFLVVDFLIKAGVNLTYEHHFRQGLLEAYWPGRLERLPNISGEPTIWLDGAHNLPAAQTLVKNLDIVRDGRSPLVLLLGIMVDKDIKGILNELVPAADLVVYSRPDYNRAADPTILAAASIRGSRGEIVPDLSEALKRAKELAGSEGVILVTGSLFIIGETLAILKK